MKILPATSEVIRAMEGDGASSVQSKNNNNNNVREDAKELCALLQPYWAGGDHVVKVVHCRHFYTAVLLESGILLLFCPQVPERHGGLLNYNSERVTDVAAGDAHIVFCTATGAVYSMGYGNRYGQLGDGSVWGALPDFREEVDAHNEDEEAEVAAAEEEAVGAGGASEITEETQPPHIPLLSYPVRIPSFGLPMLDDTEDEGELEKKDLRSTVGVPRDHILICSVACGAEHTLLMTENMNAVYACGRGHLGQLGVATPVAVQTTFRSIRLLFGLPIKMIAAAGHHSFVLLRTGRLFGFGGNYAGQLGLGTTRHASIPTLVSFLPSLIETIAPGPDHINERLGVSKKRLLDAKTYSTLRADYATHESTHFPMRVSRLPEEPNPNEPFITHVWVGPTTTVVLTDRMEWLSCGMPVTQSWRQQSKLARAGTRYDGYGALGRHITQQEEALRFGVMHWTAALQHALATTTTTAPSAAAEGGVPPQVDGNAASSLEGTDFSQTNGDDGVLGRVSCLCYPHATVVNVMCRPTSSPAEGESEGEALNGEAAEVEKQDSGKLFIENGVCSTVYVEDDKSTKMKSLLLPSRSRAALLLADQIGEYNAFPVGACDDDDALTLATQADSKVLSMRDYVIIV